MDESPLALHRSSPTDLQERNRASLEGLPFLVLRDADGRQRIMRLQPHQVRLSIGRLDDNDVSLPWDVSVSRLHAVLERIGGVWTLVDDGLSANGSFVNESRVTGRQRLADRDVLRCGRTLIAFCNPRERDEERTSVGGNLLGRLPGVTDAQRRVLVALCRPYSVRREFAAPASTAQIAEELFLSHDAIKTHLRNLYSKFDLDDLPHKEKRVALAERALAMGIVSGRDYTERFGTSD
jgi:hypothetical protein